MKDNVNQGQAKGQSTGAHDDLARALQSLKGTNSPGAESRSGDGGNFTPPNAGACPDLGEWLHLATGTTAATERGAMLSHVALCSACLARLRECQQALSSNPWPDESEELKNFASVTPQWQRRLAVELAGTPHRAQRKQTSRILLWAFAATAAVLVIAISAALWWRQQNGPESLLAQAYTNSRTFDLRIPGAGFTPVRGGTHLRGGSTGRQSAPLLNARAQIESKLERNPSDPHWLQMQARADLLEENYDAAIEILDRLIAAGPVTPGLLTDAGSAYFLRGTATGSENDRATALDYLRRADELAPSDPVVLFNEALVMEDRGQAMNAVETWNRYLNFERDPKWLEDGRRRLQSLEDKLSRLKTHESRMEQHLATPQAMRALAADSATLANIDEELSWTLLPPLLDAAYPLPVDRSRGSPCDERCLAARSLLHALAASLEAHHQDPWLTRFLPSDSSLTDSRFAEAAHLLGKAIHANTSGSYGDAESLSQESRELFHKLGDTAGEARAEVERIYALQRSNTYSACHEAIEKLLPNVRSFAWIEAQAVGQDASCNMNAGTAAVDSPIFMRPIQLAQAHHYGILELRARNLLGGAAVETADTETAWRMCMETMRQLYAGDYPPFRAATTIASVAVAEQSTPRVLLDLLLNREAVALFSLSRNRTILASQRNELIRAALRAGHLQEAKQQMALAQSETALPPRQRAESEIEMAELYLDRGDTQSAAEMLDAARDHMTGQDNDLQVRNYAVARGELELAIGHDETAESLLRAAILREELAARGAGRQNISFARRDRDLYAALAGVWFAEGRSGADLLALWERYRLRILGEPVPACPAERLDCLAPQLRHALEQQLPVHDQDVLLGQIVLRDRVLLYRADARKVTWRQVSLQRAELLSASTAVERVTGTASSSQAAIDQAARKVGEILFGDLRSPEKPDNLLVLEPDPLLGNVPWPAVETADGPIGLRFNLQEAPTILQSNHAPVPGIQARPLIVGASAAAGELEFLPEVLQEARAIAAVESNSTTLLAGEATEAKIAAHLASASLIHFAGHATQYGGATRLLLAPSGISGDKPYLDSSLLLNDPPRAARLVVFSACSTGKREEGWNHGMGDIVDTLASLGVPEVVATRWQIDSASAVLMMSAFYRGLADGLAVPQALTAARQSLVRDARYRHPYYWAAYYASGVGNTNLREVFHGDTK